MQKSIALAITCCALASNAFALELGKAPVKAETLITSAHTEFLNKAAMPTQPVYLMQVNLSAQELKVFNQSQSANSIDLTAESKLPKQIQLGMNNVPVLNQGRHGTCVTFATTAALDAVMDKGDYVSQLCSLELGAALANESYFPSGWNGSYGDIVLDRFLEHGVVDVAQQKKGLCGVVDYPVNDEQAEGMPISAQDYASLSKNINESIFRIPLLSVAQRVYNDKNTDGKLMNQVVQTVKAALADKRGATRVTFGTLIPVKYCHVGACGKNHVLEDTWVLSDAISNDATPELAGHEMVITGYDDNAVAVDDEGKQHKGLFTLRNSWGSSVGDHGNFYMSYDYFKRFAIEANQIVKLES